MRPRFRLSGVECERGNLLVTKPEQRKPATAKRRRPKIKVVDGKVIITTRKVMPPRPKQEFPMLASTMPSGKKFKIKKLWDMPDRLGTRTGAYFDPKSAQNTREIRNRWRKIHDEAWEAAHG